ncbi:MAG: methylmalonyl-CoA mutase [Candidatus Schekmanbacteria bacterium]|nr:methylmalonyl-CoA mutase [Candidatus Schekmanbacteria bacterium]
MDKNELKKIEQQKLEWEKNELADYLKTAPERAKQFETNSEIPVERVYTPIELDKEGFDFEKDLGFPGQFPYTRGITPSMFRSQLWTMGQYSGFGSAEDTNKRYKYLLAQGQKGNSVAFDLPTQLGYDSDHPVASGEVGKVGAAVDTLRDFEILFDGISIGEIRQSMTINATATIILSMYIAIAEKQGIPKSDIEVFMQNDILKEYVARGAYIFPVKPSIKLVTDIYEYCSKYMPKSSPQRICGYHMREAGSNAVQELAFTLANAISYLTAAKERGLNIDDFAHGLLIFLSGDGEFFEEIAKFRACRRMWAKMMRERFGAKDPRSMQVRFFGYTAGSTMTAQQPLNNIIRATIESMAMLLGGGNIIFVSSYDESLALPSEESVTIALRTQQIIAEESGIAKTVDPIGGSYYVETLTNRLEKEALKYIQKIDEMGGSVIAIEKGYIQEEIARESYKMQKKIEKGEKAIVGVNKYRDNKQQKTAILKVDPDVERNQKERLRQVKRDRDNEKVKQILSKIKEVAVTKENIMPTMIEAVKCYASIGEISDALREVYGKYEGKVYL